MCLEFDLAELEKSLCELLEAETLAPLVKIAQGGMEEKAARGREEKEVMLGAMGLFGGGGGKSHGGLGGRGKNCIQGLLCLLFMGCGSNNGEERVLRQ